MVDLHWLIHQGAVLEFADGRMETAKKPLPKPPPPEKTKKAPSKPVTGETPAPNEISVGTDPTAAATAQESATSPEATEAGEVVTAPEATEITEAIPSAAESVGPAVETASSAEPPQVAPEAAAPGESTPTA
jgi:hypothetical protein